VFTYKKSKSQFWLQKRHLWLNWQYFHAKELKMLRKIVFLSLCYTKQKTISKHIC
jgi:hypothetical protein